MQAIADAEAAKGGAKITIAPWDYRYYAEKVRKAKYDLDQNEVKPYLQLDKLREAMFWAAGQLYGFTFTPGRRTSPVLPPGHPRLRGDGRAPASTSASGTSTPTRGTASRLRRLDERVPHPGEVRRRGHAHRLQQRELREGQARRAGADLLGRRGDDVPRVRPRAARPPVRGQLPVAGGHDGRARLRRVPLPAQRALAGDARGAEPLRAPLQDGQAHPEGARGQDREGAELQPGLRDTSSTSRRRSST